MANWGGNRLYSNNGDRTFTDVTQEAGVYDSWWSWGTSFLDYDNDGDLDLIATNGFTSRFVDDRTHLWRNDGGVFTDVSDSAGIVDTAQGLAHLDYDSDGDLDIVSSITKHSQSSIETTPATATTTCGLR